MGLKDRSGALRWQAKKTAEKDVDVLYSE